MTAYGRDGGAPAGRRRPAELFHFAAFGRNKPCRSGPRPQFRLARPACAAGKWIIMSGTQTLVLTGASRGIGHATARTFSEDGWRVITISRQAFSPRCPWAGGPQDHVQLDIGDIGILEPGIAEIRAACRTGGWTRWSTTPASRPRGRTARGSACSDSTLTPGTRCSTSTCSPTALLARGLIDVLAAAQGAIVNVTSIAGSRVHPYAGAAYAEQGGAADADA